ncbi:MAG: DUF4097 family beta strand repeat-containing protein [Acidobacteriota bacterium]
MRKLPVLAAILSVGLATSACDIKTTSNGSFSFDIAAGKAEDTWSRTYKVADKGRFELINVNGKITAESTDGSEVIVEGHRTAKATSDEAAKELLAKLEIREEVGDSTVRVESRPPRFNGGFNGLQIEWTIKVPKGIVLDLRTVNGGIRLMGIANEVHAKTTNGGVHGEKVDASVLEATAVNGGIDIALAQPLESSDSIEMETVNGGVTLELPNESKATIDARCVNGGVHVDDVDIKRDDQGNDFEKKRRLNGTMNGGGASVKLNTTNGGIHLSRASKSTT